MRERMKRTVGISEMIVSTNPDDILITYSLGSCIGVTVYDPEAMVGGLIHCMLPLSKIDKEKARKKPCMFVDTGIPALLNRMFKKGADRKRLITKVAGGSELMDEKKIFKIGERNYAVLRKLLWKNSILIDAEHVGGQISRTITLELATGRTTIKSKGKEWEL